MDMKKDHISRIHPGFTVMLAFGKYGGFHFRKSEGTLGICLGWMALTFYAYDYEEGVGVLIDKAENNEQGFSAN